MELSVVTDFEQKEYGAGLAGMASEVAEPRQISPVKIFKPVELRDSRGSQLTAVTIHWNTNVDLCS